MKQIIITLHGKHNEQNLPQSHIDVKRATGRRSNPLVKLLPEREEENIFTPKPTLFVSTMISVSAKTCYISPHFLKIKMWIHPSERCIINSALYGKSQYWGEKLEFVMWS